MATRFVRGAAFAVLCAIWGSTWLAIRIGLQGAPPFLSASLRFVVASLVLVAIALVFEIMPPSRAVARAFRHQHRKSPRH